MAEGELGGRYTRALAYSVWERVRGLPLYGRAARAQGDDSAHLLVNKYTFHYKGKIGESLGVTYFFEVLVPQPAGPGRFTTCPL